MAEIETRFNDKWLEHRDTGCHIWLAAKWKREGYGQFHLNGKTAKAHRVAWELHNGPIPEGMCVCHTCDDRLCVNPDHLFLGTYKDNHDDMKAKGRGNIGSRHGLAKLTEETAMAIFKADGYHHEIAEKYGVTKGAVGLIKRKERWRHIHVC